MKGGSNILESMDFKCSQTMPLETLEFFFLVLEAPTSESTGRPTRTPNQATL